MTVSAVLSVQRHTKREHFHLSSSPALEKEEEEVQSPLSQRALPGILVLNRDGHVFYQSLAAQDIQKGLAENHSSYFYKIVAEFYAEIKRQIDRTGCFPSFVNRVCSLNSENYLLRALPLYSQEDPSDFKHLLVLFEPAFQSNTEKRELPIRLTPREKRVVRLLSDGKTNKEVATCMKIGEYTVKDHIKRVMRKFGVSTRTGIVAKSLSNGFDLNASLSIASSEFERKGETVFSENERQNN